MIQGWPNQLAVGETFLFYRTFGGMLSWLDDVFHGST
jgi:hypothetical protein